MSAFGGFALRQLGRTVVEGADSPGRRTQSRPISDPTLSGGLLANNFDQTTRLVLGVITDIVAPAHCYRVALEKVGSVIPCCLMSRTSLSAYGARELNTIQPGTMVFVAWHPKQATGVILGVIPPPLLNIASGAPDAVSQSSRQRVDQAHQQPILTPNSSFITNWLANRPMDSTMVGEWGAITETGARSFLDPWMLQFAIDEMCGLYLFYHDQMTRLAGYNLQLWSACSERESLNDQGEGDDYEGITPYPWEQTGLFAFGGDPHRELTAQQWQNEQPYYAAWEAADDYMQPWHRLQRFKGYLGQGGKTLVTAGPASPPQYNLYSKPDDESPGPDFRGLFDWTVGLDGRATFQSAKGISIAKRIFVASPRKLIRPDDPSGDTSKNYLPAGLSALGSGPAHTITGDINTSGDNEQLQRVAGVLDLHSYLFNYAAVHPFFWHALDWDVPDEGNTDYIQGQPVQFPTFSDLQNQQYVDAPDSLPFTKLDHRYGDQDFFPNMSGFDLLEDGSVFIYDGFGSSIAMTGGSIFQSAPGDIWRQSGRNLVDWAGFDFIVRAQNSADITTTVHDIRLKAEQHVQILAGNSGDSGCVLIESRGDAGAYEFEGNVGEDVTASGIIFRSPHTAVVTWARDIYLRTGGGAGQFAIDPGGSIVLDANQGQSTVIVNAADEFHFLTDEVLLVYGKDEQKVHSLGSDGVVIDGQLLVQDTTVINAEVLTNGTIFVADGHIVTSEAQDTDGLVADLEGQGLAQAKRTLAQVEQLINNQLPQRAQQGFTEFLQNQFYASGEAGSDDVINSGTVSLRTVPQYKTDSFSLFETLWQQVSRLRGDNLPMWQEKTVACLADPNTYPYPGRENFQGETFNQQDLNIFSVQNGASQPRSQDSGDSGGPTLNDPYDNPEYAEPKQVSLNKYPVVMSPSQ